MDRKQIIEGFTAAKAGNPSSLRNRILHHVAKAGEVGITPRVLINKMHSDKISNKIAEACADMVAEGLLALKPAVSNVHNRSGYLLCIPKKDEEAK